MFIGKRSVLPVICAWCCWLREMLKSRRIAPRRIATVIMKMLKYLAIIGRFDLYR